MTQQELDKLIEKLCRKFKGTPGIDRDFIQKCLGCIADLNDPEVETKLFKLLSRL